jgi:hypothetical protein
VAVPVPVPVPALPSPLAAEVSLLDQARALAPTQPTEALRLIDDHAVRFPHGVLRDEAALVRLEALLTAGRRADAERYAQPIIDQRPGTPIARRMTALLGSSPIP